MQQRRAERVHQHRVLRERWRRRRLQQRAAAASSRGLSADLLLRGAALHDPVHLCQKVEARRVVAVKSGQAATRQQLPSQVPQATQQRRLFAEGQTRRVLAQPQPGALRGRSRLVIYTISLYSVNKERKESLFSDKVKFHILYFLEKMRFRITLFNITRIVFSFSFLLLHIQSCVI